MCHGFDGKRRVIKQEKYTGLISENQNLPSLNNRES